MPCNVSTCSLNTADQKQLVVSTQALNEEAARTQRNFAFGREVAAYHGAFPATFAEISLDPQDTSVLHETAHDPVPHCLLEQHFLAACVYKNCPTHGPCGNQLFLMLSPDALDYSIARALRTGFFATDLAPMGAFFGFYPFGQAAVRLFLSLAQPYLTGALDKFYSNVSKVAIE